MHRRSIGLLVAAAGLAAALAGPAMALETGSTPKAYTIQASRRFEFRRENVWGGFGIGRSHGRRAGPGWSNRHVQRMARKRRNQARHRRACRG